MMNAVSCHRILVVEDNPSDVEFLRLAAEELDLPVDLEVCSSGPEAIERLTAAGAERVPHLVLLDLNLPGCPGQEVLNAIRKHRGLQGLPVVVLTTSNAQSDQGACKKLGVDAYLIKPDRYDELLDLVDGLRRYLPS